MARSKNVKKQKQEHVVELDRYLATLRKLGVVPVLFLTLFVVLLVEKGLVEGALYSAVTLTFLGHFAVAYILTGFFLKKEAVSVPKIFTLIAVVIGDTLLIYNGKYTLVMIFVLVPSVVVGFLAVKALINKK